MKLPDLNRNSSHISNGINTFSLVTVSLLWGHMLGLVSWWWLPITLLCLMIAYGTEISERKSKTTLSL